MRESKETLPARKKKGKRERRRSDRTQKLHEKREAALQRLTRGSPAWREARSLYRNQINHSCRRDWREYVEGVVQEIEKANEAGNSRAVWEAVRHLGGSSKRAAPKQPSVTPEGDTIRISEELS